VGDVPAEQEYTSMKKSSIILLIAGLILAAGLCIAGCVSDSGTSSSDTTTVTGDHGAPSDMTAGNMTKEPPEMPAGNMTDRPPHDMQAGNMTGEPPEMPGTTTGGPQPAGVPPSETEST